MTSVASLSYGFFLFITVSLYWLLPLKWRKHFLLVVSLTFLGRVSFKLLLLILLLSIFTFLAGKMIYGGRKGKGKGFLILSLLIPIGILAYYKYIRLIVGNLNYIFSLFKLQFSLTAPQIILFIGISFFTFKLIHYLISCYKGEAPIKRFPEFLLYMAFFPIFISGPIERWPHFAAQTPTFNNKYIFTGLSRVLIGVFKKKVLADNLLVLSNVLNTSDASNGGYWIAAYAYTFQIYLDFSGYSDIAIGSAKLFGYDIMENFNWPYLQHNLSQFWKKWHMSLTSWFTEYVFIPLGGSRGSFFQTILNTLIVMALTGIWHGAAWHFMLWGIYHALGLIIWRIYGLLIRDRLSPSLRDSLLLKGISTLLTFQFVVVGWVFFATDFRQSLYVVSKMFLLN